MIHLLIAGIVVGVANIIPGVSGGTAMVITKIWDNTLFHISNILNKGKRLRSLKYLSTLMVGMIIGIISFAYLIDFLLEWNAGYTYSFFAGLIIAATMSYANTEFKYKSDYKMPYVFIGVILISILAYFDKGNANEVEKLLTIDPKMFMILLGVGAIIGATMIIPGISGSLILVMLGYYSNVVAYLKDLKNFDMNTILALVAIAVGAIVGIFIASVLLKKAVNKYSTEVKSSVFGVMLASAMVLSVRDSDLGSPILRLVVLVGAFFVYYIPQQLLTSKKIK